VPRVEPAAAVCRALLDLMGRVLDALAVVDDILEANSSIPADGYGPDKDESHLRSALRCVQELGPEWNAEAIETACAELRSALDDGEDGSRQAVERIKDAVLPPPWSSITVPPSVAGSSRTSTNSAATSQRWLRMPHRLP